MHGINLVKGTTPKARADISKLLYMVKWRCHKIKFLDEVKLEHRKVMVIQLFDKKPKYKHNHSENHITVINSKINFLVT